MSETTTLDPMARVLAALAPRQVANDKIDREDWLRKRLYGVTATTAKVLANGSSAEKSAELKKKLEGDKFTGTKNTDWGSHREAFLLQEAQATEYGWLIHPTGKPRHLATPDGIRLTWDGFAIVECKTSKYEIPLGSKMFNDYGYLWQILWQMYCAETDEAYYIWEQHDDDWSRWANRPKDRPEEWEAYGPKPIKRQIHHIVLTPELKEKLEQMILASDRFLGRLDKKVAELKAAQVDAPVDAEMSHAEKLVIQNIETQAKLYRKGLDAEKASKGSKEIALATLLEISVKHWGDEDGEHLLDHPSDSAKRLRVGYSPAGTRAGSEPDEAAAKAADPKLWEKVDYARTVGKALEDQWAAHLAKHQIPTIGKVAAKVGVTEKKAE